MNYIRWGRTDCPDVAQTELVYSGRAAGSFWNQRGSASNYLCLPDSPQFLDVVPGLQEFRGRIFGAEYQTNEGGSPLNSALAGLFQDNVPCAVCSTARGEKLMIPAQTSCAPSWTEEYKGYLMSEFHDSFRTLYVCVDANPEAIPGTATNTNGALFYHVEVRDCSGLSCPPYTEGHELACVVCTR